MIDITGLDKAEVLAALYNGSRQQGMGFMHARGASGMTTEEARAELRRYSYFDYLHGRVMKVDLSGDTLDEWAYDRDNGYGAAARAIDRIRRAVAPSITAPASKQQEDEDSLSTSVIYAPTFGADYSAPEPASAPSFSSGGGGDFGGGGASGSWDSGSSSSSSSSSDSSSSSSSSDSGSSSSSD